MVRRNQTVRQVKMSSRAEVFRAKAEMCRVQAALRGDTPVGRRWLKLSQQWSEMAENAKEAPELTGAVEHPMVARAVPPPARGAA